MNLYLKWQAKMKHIIIILYSLSINLSCINTPTKMVETNNDALQKPTYMTQNATLLNYGSDVEPIMVWADYIGPLSKDGKVYSHIHGVQYFYVKAEKKDTLYYENIGLRNSTKSFDFKNCSTLNYPGDATIQISNKEDSLVLFSVLESSEFSREHKGIKFKRMPTIALVNHRYLADVDIEFNLKKVKEAKYELTLNDSSIVEYKACSKCNITIQEISFLNRQDGRIYLIDQDKYLELVNKGDVKIFQGLR